MDRLDVNDHIPGWRGHIHQHGGLHPRDASQTPDDRLRVWSSDSNTDA